VKLVNTRSKFDRKLTDLAAGVVFNSLSRVILLSYCNFCKS